MKRTALLLLWMLGVSIASPSCRCTPTPDAAPASDAAPPELPSVGPLPVRSSRLAAPAADAPCEGASLALLTALFDDRCAVSERDWKSLIAAPSDGGSAVQQEARRDGDRVVFGLVNRGAQPVSLPIQAIFGRPDLAPFSIYAEGEKQAVYELAPPSAGDVPDPGHVHRARITLPPRGEASVSLAVDPTVVGRLAPECSDAAPCTERRLPPGRYTLYVGQRLVPEAGPPAKIAWEIAP